MSTVHQLTFISCNEEQLLQRQISYTPLQRRAPLGLQPKGPLDTVKPSTTPPLSANPSHQTHRSALGMIGAGSSHEDNTIGSTKRPLERKTLWQEEQKLESQSTQSLLLLEQKHEILCEFGDNKALEQATCSSNTTNAVSSNIPPNYFSRFDWRLWLISIHFAELGI